MSIKAKLSAKSASLQKKNSKKGFTLVELVIVIAVLAIIAAIAIPTVVNVINNANKSTDITNAQSVENAIKTAESEVAANATNPSTRVTALGTSGDLDKLLKAYGVDITVITKPKDKDATFVYDQDTHKVTACGSDGKTLSDSTKPSPSGTTCITLSDSTAYTIAGDTLTVGSASAKNP